MLCNDCISKINRQVNNAKDLDIVMAVYDSIEWSDNYSKSYGSLWQYCRNKPPLGNAAIAESEWFKFE